MIADSNTHFCAYLAETLLHFLWQGALIAALTAVVVLLFRRLPVRVRYGIYVAALGLMTLCPLITLIVLAGSEKHPAKRTDSFLGEPARITGSLLFDIRNISDKPADEQRVAFVHPANLRQTTLNSTRSILMFFAQVNWQSHASAVVIVYLAGVLIMLGRLLLALGGGQRLCRCAQPVDDPAVLEVLSRGAAALKLRAKPALAWCLRVTEPTVIGVLRPMILLPFCLASGLGLNQVELLLLHELAHIRRYDHWVNFVQSLVETILFFHPAVWWISRHIRTERELCCDDMVVAMGVRGLVYADSLLRMIELSRRYGGEETSPFLALGAGGFCAKLDRRILRLIEVSPNEPIRMAHVWPLSLGLIMIAFATLVGLTGRTAILRPYERLFQAKAIQDTRHRLMENTDRYGAAIEPKTVRAIVQAMADQEARIQSLHLVGKHFILNQYEPKTSQRDLPRALLGRIDLKYQRQANGAPRPFINYDLLTEVGIAPSGKATRSHWRFLLNKDYELYWMPEEADLFGTAELYKAGSSDLSRIPFKAGPGGVELFSAFSDIFSNCLAGESDGKITIFPPHHSQVMDPRKNIKVVLRKSADKSGYLLESIEFLDGKGSITHREIFDEWISSADGTNFPGKLRMQFCKSDKVCLEYMIHVEKVERNIPFTPSDFEISEIPTRTTVRYKGFSMCYGMAVSPLEFMKTM